MFDGQDTYSTKMEEHTEKAFPGCKHTTDSAFNSIFNSITSLVLIVHMIFMVSCFEGTCYKYLDLETTFK